MTANATVYEVELYACLPTVEGLETLTPTNPAELSSPFAQGNVNVRLDAATLVAEVGDLRARFRRTSFNVFAYLWERAGQWVTSHELRVQVLRTCYSPGASNVRWHILEARRALGPASWCLHSDRRRGYMFLATGCTAVHCARTLRT